MSNKTNSLIQKLNTELKEEELKRIAQNILDLTGEEETALLLEELFLSTGESDQISGILLAGHLPGKDFISQVYKHGSSKGSPAVQKALLKSLALQDTSSSQKLLLQIMEESNEEEILLQALEQALNQKVSLFSKGLLVLLKKENPNLKEKIRKRFRSLGKKKFFSISKTLLRQKDEEIQIFTLEELKLNPSGEIAASLNKMIKAQMSSEVLSAILSLFPLLPETNGSLETARKLLGLSQKAEPQIWEDLLKTFSVIFDGRRRVAVDYFKSWFDLYQEERQVQIVDFVAEEKDHYNVEYLCRWACLDTLAVREKALEALETFEPQDSFYEMFRYLENHRDHTEKILPLMLKIAGKKKTTEIEDLTNHLPPDFQRDFIRQVFSSSSQNLLTTAFFKNLCREYNKLDEFGTILIGVDRLPRCYERDKEINHILKRLKREGNKSFILLGPSGTGKSAIFNELAYRLIAHKDPTYPYEMILQITTGDILAGTKYLGEWETRVNKLLQTLKYYKKVVLYVSNINDLIWAGRSSSSRTNFASVMSPYIERGDLVVVGESTPEAYSIGIGSEYNIKKLFQTIQLKEMDDDGTDVVLKKLALDLKSQIQRTKKVDVETPSTVLNRIIELGTYYFPGIARPGNAAHLLQQVMETRSDDLIQEEMPKEIKTLTLTPDDVMRTLSDTMEVPELIINDNIKLNIEDVRKFFSERVLGQEQAVNNLVSLISLIKAGLSNPERPHGVFFFIGPTGVGKTEMARVLAEYLTGNPDRLIRMDMSAFKDYSSFERLIGSHHHLTPQGSYITPNLVEKIRNHPFSVILLDEFEKAHPNIFDLFLQVYDYGKLLDARSEPIDFRQSIIIMTSNIGYEESLEDKVGFEDRSHLALSADEAKREMARIFRPEFINRIDKIVIFHPLDKETMLKITHREIGKILSRSGLLRRNLDVKVDYTAVELLLEKGFSPRLGARQLKRVVEEKLLHPLAETIVRWSPEHGSHIFISADGEDVKVLIKESRAKSRNTRILERVRRKNKDSSQLVTTKSLGDWVKKLNEKITALEKHCEKKDYHKTKRELFQKTMDVTFWDNPEKARGILEEIHYLERILYSISKLRKAMCDLDDLMEMSRTNTSKKILAQAALRYMEVKKEYEIVEFEAHCESKKERSDAFLTFSLSAPSQLAGKSAIEILYEMYSRWSEKNAFVIVPLYEETFSNGSLKSLTCYLQGVCVYGMLEMERGIHRVEKDGKKDEVEVHVLPKMGPRLKEDDFELSPESRKDPSKNYFFDETEELVVIKHHYSNLILKAFNPKDTQDNLSLLKDLLAAKIHETPQKKAEVIRTYYLSPGPKIYDHILESSFENLEEMLAGDIDEIFIAKIQKIHSVEEKGAERER